MKWRPDHGVSADMRKTFAQQRMPRRYGLCQCGIVSDEPGLGCGLIGR
jgi:hypothetical protein